MNSLGVRHLQHLKLSLPRRLLLVVDIINQPLRRSGRALLASTNKRQSFLGLLDALPRLGYEEAELLLLTIELGFCREELAGITRGYGRAGV